MYLPPQFASTDLQHALALMRAHPLASLISCDDEGQPFVTHLPLHVRQQDDALVLLGHVARANPHGDYLRSRPRALVTFVGPQAYMSPTVYPDLAQVPTWNYLAVHCTVQARLIEEAAAKEALLKRLIADHEPAYARQWAKLEPAYREKMLAGITAFELQVLQWQCKLKLNQHRPQAHGAMRARYQAGTEAERELADWMDRLGLHGH